MQPGPYQAIDQGIVGTQILDVDGIARTHERHADSGRFVTFSERECLVSVASRANEHGEPRKPWEMAGHKLQHACGHALIYGFRHHSGGPRLGRPEGPGCGRIDRLR